jgi:hypothetical protein
MIVGPGVDLPVPLWLVWEIGWVSSAVIVLELMWLTGGPDSNQEHSPSAITAHQLLPETSTLLSKVNFGGPFPTMSKSFCSF